MPEPFTIMVLILFGCFLGSLAFWNHIVHFVSTRLVPLLRSSLGDGVADSVVGLFQWLDGKVTLTRNAVRAGVRAIFGQVRKLATAYRKTGPATVERTTETVVAVGGKGRVVKVVEEDVPLDDVPEVPRVRLIANPTASVSVDALPEVQKAVNEKARREGMAIMD